MATYGIPYPITAHNFLSVQPLVWKAILEQDPYPVKALFTWTTNVLVNGGDVKTIYKALKSPNLDLHVVLDHVMTPTALLADYVLPAASKLEKIVCHTHEDFAPLDCVRRGGEWGPWVNAAAITFSGRGWPSGSVLPREYFPWKTEEELADYRLAPLGLTFEEVAKRKYYVNSDRPWTYDTLNPRTGAPTGFGTPSGKVELFSQVLEELGYDPLPFYEEPPESPVSTPDVAQEYPYILITGGNFRPMFHSENRHFGMGTREQHPDPLVELHPGTAGKFGIAAARLGIYRNPPGRHPSASRPYRRDRSTRHQRAEPLVVSGTTGPGTLAARAVGIQCQCAHHGRRPPIPLTR